MSKLVIFLGIILTLVIVFYLALTNFYTDSNKHSHLIISEENLQEPFPKDTDYQRSLKIINLEKRIKELEELISKLVIVKQDPYIIDTNTILITNLTEIQFLSRY